MVNQDLSSSCKMFASFNPIQFHSRDNQTSTYMLLLILTNVTYLVSVVISIQKKITKINISFG